MCCKSQFISLFIDALGQMNAFTPTSVYLVDSKPGRSASAVGINNAVRSVLAAVATIFSSQCVEAAGTGVLFTILAAINVVNCLTLVAVMVWGKKWRENFEHRTGTSPVAANTNGTSVEKDAGSSIHSSATNVGDSNNEYNTELAIVHSRVSQV